MTTTLLKSFLPLCLLVIFLSTPVLSALSFSRAFGPVFTEKSNPRTLEPDQDGNFIEISESNNGCGSFDRVTVVKYDLSAAPVNSQLWEFQLTCGSIREYPVASYADPVNGGVYFLTSNANSVFTAYYVTSAGIVQQGTFTDASFSRTNLGIVKVASKLVVYNADGLRTVDGATVQSNGADTYWAMTSDGTFLYLFGSTAASSGFYVAKGTFSSGIFSFSNTPFSPTLSGGLPMRASMAQDDVTFFYKKSVYLCAGHVYATLISNSDRGYETTEFDANAALVGAYSSTLGADDAVIDFRCNQNSGRGYVLGETLTTFPDYSIAFSYKVYNYFNRALASTVSVIDGSTTTILPRYIALVASPLGALYLHRERQQSVGNFTEIYGQLFTNCAAGTYGISCLPCLCVNGICDSGESGTGTCLSCNSTTVFGPYCNNTCACVVPTTPCSNGINGTGQCDCQDPKAFGFNCEECESGYFMNNLTVCQICPVGYYCVNSTKYPCEGNYVAGLSICNQPTDAPTPSPTGTIPPEETPTPTPTSTNENSLRPDFLIAIILGAIFAGLLAVLIIFGSVFYHKNFKSKAVESQDVILT